MTKMDQADLKFLSDLMAEGKVTPFVEKTYRLNETAEALRYFTEGHARAILSLPEHDERKRLARRVVRDGLSVRAHEKAAQEGGAKRKAPRATKVDPLLAARVAVAAERLTGFKARVSGGKLEIGFRDETELAELAEALENAVSV